MQVFRTYSIQDIKREGDKWNTSEVLWMTSMFQDATKFNQDLSGWSVGKIAKSPPKVVSGSKDFDTGANAWTQPKPTF